MRHRHTILAAAVLALAACDSSTGPARYTAQGSWSGQETAGATVVSLVLTQQGDAISGTGSVVGARTIPVTATGSAISTRFELTLTSPGFQPVEMIGGFTARDQIEAYMAGSGFYGDHILLNRQ